MIFQNDPPYISAPDVAGVGFLVARRAEQAARGGEVDLRSRRRDVDRPHAGVEPMKCRAVVGGWDGF